MTEPSKTPRSDAIDHLHDVMRDRLPPWPGCLEISAIEDARNLAFVALAHTLERELAAARHVRKIAEEQSLERAKRLDVIRKAVGAEDGETTEAAIERQIRCFSESVDMADVGRAFMAKLPKDYCWHLCPSEYITRLTDERDGLSDALTEIERQRRESTDYAEECRSLLRQARCPNAPSCDGKGTIAHWGVDNSIDRQPCQWCHERDAALAKNPNPAGARRTEASSLPEASGPVGLGPVHRNGCDGARGAPCICDAMPVLEIVRPTVKPYHEWKSALTKDEYWNYTAQDAYWAGVVEAFIALGQIAPARPDNEPPVGSPVPVLAVGLLREPVKAETVSNPDDLLSRVKQRRGADQLRKLRGERPQDDPWPWIHEAALIAEVERLRLHSQVSKQDAGDAIAEQLGGVMVTMPDGSRMLALGDPPAALSANEGGALE